MPDHTRVHEQPPNDQWDRPRPANRDSPAYKLGRCVGALELIVKGYPRESPAQLARETLEAIGFDPDTNTWIHKP
jgi:hypothetical protein